MRLEVFRDPGVEFSEVALWCWNDRLTDKELLRQLDALEAGGWQSFFIVAAPGLVTPYLSGEWMQKVKLVVEEADRRGMKAWLYDENIYPSGYAEGLVPALDTHFRLKALMMRVAARPDRIAEEVAVFECDSERGEITNPVRIESGGDAKPGKVYLEFCQYTASIGEGNLAHMTAVDVLSPAAADAFIQCTYERYACSVGRWFGQTVAGVFTDEPQYLTGRRVDSPALPWTDRLPEHFRRMHGYDLAECLPSLFFPWGRYAKVRVDFWRCVTDLFVGSWSRKIYEWCDKHGLMLTGHVMQEDTLTSQIEAVGAAMPHLEYMHAPGMDQLGLEAPEWMRGDRGIATILTVKQASSVAAQLGRQRVFCECFAASGQDMSFEDRKWIGDWLGALGVTMFCPSISPYSLRGNRKRFVPPALFFQQPWWEHNAVIADYYRRLSYSLSQGKAVRDVAVIHPMGSAWAVYTPLNTRACAALDEDLAWLQHELLRAHRDYDLADETMMEKYGAVDGDFFVVGECRYNVVVLPAATTWAGNTVKMLSDFVSNGGTLVAMAPLATMVDGEASDELSALMDKTRVAANRDSEALRRALEDREASVAVRGEGADGVLCQLRKDDGKTILFLANGNRDKACDVEVSVLASGACWNWDLFSGRTEALSSRREGARQVLSMRLPPVGSRLTIIDESQKPPEPVAVPECERSPTELGGTWEISRHHPNALNVDYCRVSIRGEKWSEVVPVADAREKILKAGYGSEYKLQYGFKSSLASGARGQLCLAVELAEGLEVKVNGHEINGADNGYWIDPAFRTVDIRDLAVAGDNVVEVRGTAGVELPRTPLWAGTWGPQVEDCYVVGDFAVQPAGPGGFELVEEAKCVSAGDLTTQGYPFYPGAISLTQDVEIDDPRGRVFIELDGLEAHVASVSVNGKGAGSVALKPYRLEITGYLIGGKNTICVELVNSLRNLLGPLHHVKGELKWVFPESFLPVGQWWGSGEPEWTDAHNFVPFGFQRASLIFSGQGQP